MSGTTYLRVPALLLMVVVALVSPSLASARTSSSTAQSRHLASATSQLRSLKLQVHKAASVLNFYHHKGHWTLHTRYRTCRQVTGWQRVRVCRHARNLYRVTEHRLPRLEARLASAQLAVARYSSGYMSPSAARRLGQVMAARLMGWTTSNGQWGCLDRLWGDLESGWFIYADNPHSDAFGIPQALPGSKMGPGWRTSAWTQIRWGLNYIRGKYHSACGALGVRLAQGSY